MANQTPCPDAPTTPPLPSLPFPSFSSPSLPSPFPSLQVQIPFFILLPCLALRCWCLLLTPSSPTSRRLRRGIRSSLHSSRHYRGGLAGSQTPPYQKAGHRAGQRRVSTTCTTVYSTVRAVSSFHPPLPPSFSAFSNSITTLPWRGTTGWHGRMRSLVNISNGRA